MMHRDEIITRIHERLSGQLSATALATWAFDQFYALEQGAETVDPGDSELIAAILDELMFADEKPFALDDADLRRLIARLE